MKSNIISSTSRTASVSPADMPRILTAHAQSPGAKPVLFLGLPGSSKTEQMHAWAAANGFRVFSFMAPHYTPQDLKGFGVPDREAQVMRFLPSAELPFGSGNYADHPESGGLKPLLFIDEITNASIQVFNMCLQLVNERRIGDNKLFDDVFVVAAGNTSAMKSGSNKLTASVADRFAIYSVAPESNAIIDFFTEQNANPWVIAYLRAYAATGEGGMWTTDLASWNGEEPLDSARSMFKLAALLTQQYGTDDRAMLSDRLFPVICAGNIGAVAGTKFSEFVRMSVEAGNIEDMIAAAETCTLPESPSVKWGVAARCVSYATKNEDLFTKCVTLCRRLTPASMKPADGGITAFEVFLLKASAKSHKVFGFKAWHELTDRSRAVMTAASATPAPAAKKATTAKTAKSAAV